MVKNNLNVMEFTKKELDLLEHAANDFFEKGKTEIKCPRCGGDFEFDGDIYSYELRCKTENCLRDTFRGI